MPMHMHENKVHGVQHKQAKNPSAWIWNWTTDASKYVFDKSKAKEKKRKEKKRKEKKRKNERKKNPKNNFFSG